MPGLRHTSGVQIHPQHRRFHQIHLRPAAAYAFPFRQHGHDQVDGRGIVILLEGREGARSGIKPPGARTSL